MTLGQETRWPLLGHRTQWRTGVLVLHQRWLRSLTSVYHCRPL